MPNLVAALILLLLLLTLRLPALNLFSTHLLGGNGPDTYLYFWIVNSLPQNFLEYGWFETNSYYPNKYSLAFSDSFLLPTLFFCFFNKIGLSEIQSWNCLILLAQFLNGFSCYMLSVKLKAIRSVGLVIGLIFLSSAYFTEHLGHPQLQFFFFIPFTLYCFLGLLESVSLKKAVFLSLLLTCTFCCSVYYAITVCLVCFLYYFLLLLRAKRINLFQLKYLLVAALLAFSFLLPVLVPYLAVKDSFGARGLHEFYNFAFSAGSLLSSPSLSMLYGSTLNFSHSEANFFWGIGCFTLITISLFKFLKIDPLLFISVCAALLLSEKLIFSFVGRENRLLLCSLFCWITLLRIFYLFYKNRIENIFLASAVIILLISFGPLGYREISVPASAPFNIFYHLFPGLDSLRAISRLGSVFILLVLLGNIKFWNNHQYKILLLVPLILLEALTTATPLAPLRQRPEIFNLLMKNYNRGEAVIIAPISGKLDKNRNITSWNEVAVLNSEYLIDLRNERPLLLNGYSGQRPKTIYDLPKIMARFPDEKSLELLKSYNNLKWIVVLGSRIEGFSVTEFEQKISRLNGRIQLVSKTDKDYLISVN